MFSVTKRIRYSNQPRGGFLNPKDLLVTQFDDDQVLEEENLFSGLVGLVVDYLVRLMSGTQLEDAFRISIMGAERIKKTDLATSLLSDIKGLDQNSIKNACKLVGFDVCVRAGIAGYRPIEEIEADNSTIKNIEIMVTRSLHFLEKYGPITMDGFTFMGGYSALVSSGDGDFLTENTLWDFKVSKDKPTNIQTLQLLMYYIMGKRSIHNEFKGVKNIGIFNPRLNKVYLYAVRKSDSQIIKEIEEDILCYNLTKTDIENLKANCGIEWLFGKMSKAKFNFLLDGLKAKNGNASAQFNLGYNYENGCEVAQDYTKAFEWFTKAAEKGHEEAQNSLGVCYASGKGVLMCYDLAKKWWLKSADQGNEYAKQNLELLGKITDKKS